MQKIIKTYGLWQSPISASMLSQRLRLDDVQWSSSGETLIWLEGRSDRGVLVAQTENGVRKDLVDEHSVRGKVGYGGGDFCVGKDQVIFCERNSGQLHRIELITGRAKRITPPFGMAASPALSPDGKWVLYVFSDGKEDLLAIVDSKGEQWSSKLARGADFYMQPAWHPQGGRIAWVEWDHPNMPWDGSRVILGELSGVSEGGTPRLVKSQMVGGSAQIPAAQPLFSPDGRYLSFIESLGEWENLILVDLDTMSRHELVIGAGFHLMLPAWVQGMRSYGWSGDGSRLFYTRNYAGTAEIWEVSIRDGATQKISTKPYTWISQLSVSPRDNQLAFIASAPWIPDRVVTWHGSHLMTRAYSDAERVDPAGLPVPSALSWSAPDGTLVHGIYYPPASLTFTGKGLPPAIINIHGGPTSQAVWSFNGDVNYFATRGYAVVEVNYRGSSGYGRSYRDALREHWGRLDVEDAIGAAVALVDQGLADPGRLVIKGGSAGGFTVLNALVHHPGRFKAGVNLFGVSNLFTLAMDTHKFEERYTDSMVGPLPETANRYHEWSPIFHADKIRDPLAIFQGSEDKVVPPDQSESIVKVLQRNGVPHIYRLYEGEGHGFRKTETRIDYYQQLERFLQQYVIFTA